MSGAPGGCGGCGRAGAEDITEVRFQDLERGEPAQESPMCREALEAMLERGLVLETAWAMDRIARRTPRQQRSRETPPEQPRYRLPRSGEPAATPGLKEGRRESANPEIDQPARKQNRPGRRAMCEAPASPEQQQGAGT